MNYWPAEVCNLSECHQPLFDLLKDISVTGAKTAKMYYGCNGWVAHHNIDLWRGTAPTDAARFGMWPMGGAWLCQHIWEHYAFTGDRQFLKEYYPIMKGSAQFLLEVMVEEPKHHWLVTPFSMSPEHGYYDSEGKMSFLAPSPTMDVAIIRELFPHCIEAGKVGEIVHAFVGNSLAPNLHNTGANQSDASFGLTAAIAEALLQSHAGEISLLPALPNGWKEGSVKGLRARGGFEVSIQWQSGKLQSAEMRNRNGGLCAVRYGERTASLSLKPGAAMRLNADLVAAK